MLLSGSLQSIFVLALLGTAFSGSLSEAKNLIIEGVVLPHTAGTFVRTKVTDDESAYPGLGQTISYSSDLDFSATAYVYDLSLPSIPEGPLSDLNKRNMAQAFRDVHAVAGREVTVLNQGVLGTPETGGLFDCVHMRLFQNFDSRRSFLCSTGINGRFLKLRVSGPDEVGSEQVFADFVFDIAHANKDVLYGIVPLSSSDNEVGSVGNE
ncbi:hypothetical protein [Paracoccus actinidiae]|uniref:hypothetical protein n=1 Tax=Paracoccus actinidiae TaxID=3064531 RepID=UPI0027D3449C|nr:hypothetical protein [Paracoccus sp. M09]